MAEFLGVRGKPPQDADTISCMAAGICGALNGASPPNATRVEKLPEESRKAQAELASRLAAVTRTKIERNTGAKALPIIQFAIREAR